MAVRVALPESKLKARRRKRRVVWLISSLAALLVLAIAFVFVSRASFLLIQNVHAVGVETLATSTVESFVKDRIAGNYFFLIPKRNIFLYPKQGVAQDLLAAFPVLKNVSVHANTFTELGVEVNERRPEALWCGTPSMYNYAATSTSNCFSVDDSGLVYGKATESGVYISLFGALEGRGETLPMQFYTPETFRSLLALGRALGNTAKIGAPSAIVVQDTGTVKMYFSNGFFTMSSLQDDAGDILDRFNAALASSVFIGRSTGDFEYLNLSYGDKLYYRLKGGKQQATSTE